MVGSFPPFLLDVSVMEDILSVCNLEIQFLCAYKAVGFFELISPSKNVIQKTLKTFHHQLFNLVILILASPQASWKYKRQ